MDLHLSDFLTIGLLVLLEALLSADNALVLAMMILGLEQRDQKKALRYGLVGAFGFRIVVTLGAIYLIRITWIKLGGAIYLVYLALRHFLTPGGPGARQRIRPAVAWPGLPALWTTVVKVELVNIAFSVDSILVAVAMSPKLWVVLSGGLLGLLAIRFVIARLLALVRRYPALVDGAFVIVGWVGVKLLTEYLHAEGWIAFTVNRWASFALIAAIFLVSYLYARRTRVEEEPSSGPADL